MCVEKRQNREKKSYAYSDSWVFDHQVSKNHVRNFLHDQYLGAYNCFPIKKYCMPIFFKFSQKFSQCLTKLLRKFENNQMERERLTLDHRSIMDPCFRPSVHHGSMFQTIGPSWVHVLDHRSIMGTSQNWPVLADSTV